MYPWYVENLDNVRHVRQRVTGITLVSILNSPEEAQAIADKVNDAQKASVRNTVLHCVEHLDLKKPMMEMDQISYSLIAKAVMMEVLEYYIVDGKAYARTKPE